LTTWLKQLQNEVTDLLFPRECIGCGKIGDFICVRCSKKLPRLNPPLCPRCGKPETSGSLCPDCWGSPRDVDLIRSVFVFEGVIRDAVHAFKYSNLSALSGSLGSFMADYFLSNKMKGDVLIPVPLHSSRLRERGYNQSELLAREISHIINIPFDSGIVQRIRDNEPQARTKGAQQRRRNVKNVFGGVAGNVSGRDLIVVDDVCTSGATLASCAAVLKAAGARQVIGLTLAREI
jgi:competence protein ComFC